MVRACNLHGVPFVPRGGGTNLTGGTIPFKGGVVIEMIRMNRILEVDTANLWARVQPGMFNLELGNALAPLGYQFLPDPASQKAATLGGNVAENAGGPHCFKYGVTTNHVLGLTVVLPDGEVVRVAAARPRTLRATTSPGCSWAARGPWASAPRWWCGSCACPKESRPCWPSTTASRPAARRSRPSSAAGMVPATLEMMDQLVIQAVEASMPLRPARGLRHRADHRGGRAEGRPGAPGQGHRGPVQGPRRPGGAGGQGRRPSGPCCGPAGAGPSAPWPAWRPASWCATARCPAPPCRWC